MPLPIFASASSAVVLTVHVAVGSKSSGEIAASCTPICCAIGLSLLGSFVYPFATAWASATVTQPLPSTSVALALHCP